MSPSISTATQSQLFLAPAVLVRSSFPFLAPSFPFLLFPSSFISFRRPRVRRGLGEHYAPP